MKILISYRSDEQIKEKDIEIVNAFSSTIFKYSNAGMYASEHNVLKIKKRKNIQVHRFRTFHDGTTKEMNRLSIALAAALPEYKIVIK